MVKATEDIFNAIQKNVALHPRNLGLLNELWRNDPDLVKNDIFKYMKLVIQHEGDVPLKVRIFTFVSKFSVQCEKIVNEEKDSDEMDDKTSFPAIIEEIIIFLLEYINAKNKAVRWNICKFIEIAMDEIDEDVEISDNLYEEMISKLLPRLRDKNASVRVHAISSLSRLQDPDDESDDILKEFLRLLVFDANKEVRKTVLSHIGISELTIPAIINRISDINYEVRLEAIRIVQKKISIADIPQEKLLFFIKTSFEDRSKEIVKAATSMCLDYITRQGWMSFLNYFYGYSVKTYQEVSQVMEVALRQIFPRYDCEKHVEEELKDDAKDGVVSNITSGDMRANCISAFLWRCMCEYLQKSNSGLIMDKIVVSISPIIELLRESLGSTAEPEEAAVGLNTFHFIEVLKLLRYYDYSLDELGRQKLTSFLRDCLLYVKILPEDKHLAILFEETQEETLNLMEMLLEDEKRLTLMTMEIISELITDEDALSDSTIDLRTKVEPDERKSHSMLQAIGLVVSMLSRINLKISDTPVLSKLKETVVFPVLQVSESLDSDLSLKMRVNTVKALSLYSMLDIGEAKINMPVLFEIMQSEDASVTMISMQALFDIFTCYGKALFRESSLQSILNTTKDKCADALADYFLDFLDSSDAEMRILVVQGLCKLYLYGVIAAENAMGELVLLLFDPSSEDLPQIRQYLSMFFPAFAFESYDNMKILSKNAVETLQVALQKGFDVSSLAKFYGYLTNVTNLKNSKKMALEDYENFHALIVEEISILILSSSSVNKKSPIVKQFPRFMNSFDGIDMRSASRVHASVSMMREKVTDAAGRKAVASYLSQLDDMKVDYDKEDEIFKELAEKIDETHIHEPRIQTRTQPKTKPKPKSRPARAAISREKIAKLDEFDLKADESIAENVVINKVDKIASILGGWEFDPEFRPRRRAKIGKPTILDSDDESDSEEKLFATPDVVKSPFINMLSTKSPAAKKRVKPKPKVPRRRILESDSEDDDYED